MPRTSEPKRLPAPIYGIKRAAQRREDAKNPPSGEEQRERAWNAYLIPGSQTLRNKLGSSPRSYGEPDLERFLQKELALTMSRMAELETRPVTGNFSPGHLQRVHRHLFQDVYDWAGENRTVDLYKAGHSYAPAKGVHVLLERQSAQLREEHHLRGIDDPAEFAERLAFHWGMTNFAHQFREGNTRTQMAFFRQLAEQAGWELDVTKFAPDHPASIRDEFIAARFHHQARGNEFDHQPLADVLSRALSPSEATLALQETRRAEKLAERRLRHPELFVDHNENGQHGQQTMPGDSRPDWAQQFE